MSVLPDRRWLTKQILVLATITVAFAFTAGVTHMVIDLFSAPSSGIRGDFHLVCRTIGWSIPGVWLLALPVALLRFRNLEYVVEPDKIVIRRGIVTKIQQNIPLRMISDFRLHRTPYDRLLGIGSIEIQTAGNCPGGTGQEGRLTGLADWAAFHEGLRNRLRAEPPTASDFWREQEEIDGMHALLEEVRVIRRVLQRDG